MPNYRIVNRKDSAELFIYDTIGESFFGGITSKQVIDSLADIGAVKTLNVRINSAGGDVFEGFAIYNALNRMNVRIEVDIDAEAASIASIIAMAGDEIRIAENAMIMIHDPFSFTIGNSEDMRKQADIMDQVKNTLVDTYAKRTKQAHNDISKWMTEETWFNAEEAVRFGFADKTDQALKMAAYADAPWFRNAPRAIKNTGSPTPFTDMRRARIAALEQAKLAQIAEQKKLESEVICNMKSYMEDRAASDSFMLNAAAERELRLALVALKRLQESRG